MLWSLSKSVLRGLIVAVTALLTMGMAQASAPGDVTVVYSGNLDGELEPCGCTREGDFGGIRRIATGVDTLRAEHPDLFLLSTGGLFSTDLPTHRITNQYILRGLAQLGYDAVGVQWGDLAYGADFLRGTSLPLVASNWLGDGFPAVRHVSRSGRKLAYFQWLAPGQSPYQGMHGEHARVTGEVAGLASALAEAQAAGALTVLGTTLAAAQAKAVLPLDQVDILIMHAKDEQFGEPEQVGKTLLLVPGSRGQRLGRVDLTLGPDGRIVRWRHAVIPLPESVADAPRMESWYAAYTQALRQDYDRRVAIEKQAAGDSPYLGNEGCKACHAQAYTAWQDTPHAGAFATLQGVDKSFDANCIGCHTVGFGQPGGFIDPEVSGHLLGVGCEACHGPGRSHAVSPGTEGFGEGRKKAGPHTCAGCHNDTHSPSFRFEGYWPRIRHGREAAAAVSGRP